MWLVPCLVVGLSAVLAVPLGLFMARVLDRSNPGNIVERWLDTGGQNWKQYCLSLLLFNAVAFVVGFIILALQPWLPLNPDGHKMLAPSTIFNTVASFVTNTNLQHYSGEVHLSYFSQLFFVCWNQFVTPAIGVSALLAMIRGLRGDGHLGNYYLDMWRCVVYVFLPLSLIVALLLLAGGVPMTLQGAEKTTTLEGGQQMIARGPVAALEAIKQLGTNGGGFFGANSAHPLENPNAWTNLLECVSILLFPMAIVVLFGKMVGNMKHAAVIGGVMMLFLVGLLVWALYADEMQPNPAFTARATVENDTDPLYRVPLPVDQQGVGNLEGKELRFGPGAAATWVTCTTCVANGSVNCMHDSLNPLAQLTPLVGMWLNCLFGGTGVGFINMLVYLIVGVFLSGLMVGRTPEYLGKKVEAREMKLAMLALLIHPIMILVPTGLFAVMQWGKDSTGNPGAHGLTEILYEFSSASANNGSETGGLSNQNGYYVPDTAQSETSPFVDPDPKNNPGPSAPYSVPWDIVTGLVMMISRFVPIIAPLALAANLARKKPTPLTVGTLRTDTLTFAFVLLGTILLVGALLFMPVALLGPVADHFGPLPFGG